VENIVSNFEYARGWNGTPHCIWLHTTLLTPERLNPTRFDYRGMNTVQNDFREYGTVDGSGRDIMPKTNVVTFTMTKKSKEDANVTITENCQVETVMTEGEAARYTVGNVFGDWRPDKIIEQTERKVKKLMKRL
jgi:hypothetical protein